jgi:hypothetical protein
MYKRGGASRAYAGGEEKEGGVREEDAASVRGVSRSWGGAGEQTVWFTSCSFDQRSHLGACMRMSVGAQADMQQCFPACGDVEMLPFLLVVVGGGGGGGGGGEERGGGRGGGRGEQRGWGCDVVGVGHALGGAGGRDASGNAGGLGVAEVDVVCVGLQRAARLDALALRDDADTLEAPRYASLRLHTLVA